MVYFIFKSRRSSTATLFLILIFILFFYKQIEANAQQLKNTPENYLSSEIFKDIQDYLISDDHPIKTKLDKIFSNKRVMANLESMKNAGFNLLQSKHLDKIIVAKHDKIPGFIIKGYLDRSPEERSDYTSLVRRIRGRHLVKQSISTHGYKNLFKTPTKWLYLIPEASEIQKDSSRTIFIIVENEMDIVKEKKNEKLWKSDLVNKELLTALYTVMSEVGLGDVKPRNCPFCQDGRIAFVDTEGCETTPKPEKLLPYLSLSMGSHWSQLNGLCPDEE